MLNCAVCAKQLDRAKEVMITPGCNDGEWVCSICCANKLKSEECKTYAAERL